MAWLTEVATALVEVHRNGIVHRGLRPSRLFLLADDTVVLTDFGLIRGISDMYSAQVATYLAPEQAMGNQPTPQTDLYQLGLIAYECLAGQPPFRADNPLEVAMMHVRDVPPPLPDSVPIAIRDIVARCLAKSPADRWPTAGALATAAATAAT
jgi:serine/threonine-protein kinase